MAVEVAGEKLYDAAAKGDATTFDGLLQENPYLLDKVSFSCSNRTPLHIATLYGYVEIVDNVLRRNPQLAEELDAQKSSPLHIAAAKGYVEITSRLLLRAPNMCWSRDCQGMNPIHIAAMNGHVEILEEMITRDPFPAREKVGRGQTVMHLCVKHRQFRALQVLVVQLGDLVLVGDDDGETVMHLAVRCKQVEMIQYLLESNEEVKISTNSKGEIPLDILQAIPPDTITSEIKKILERNVRLPKGSLVKLTDIIIVVVILIATMAFQAVVSPPGGVWQEDSSLHKAGEAVMASNRPKIYKHFVRANTVAFASSVITIVLLTTRFPTTNDDIAVFAALTTWVSVASIAVSYGASVMVITPDMETKSFNLVICIVVVGCSAPLASYILWPSKEADCYLQAVKLKNKIKDKINHHLRTAGRDGN